MATATVLSGADATFNTLLTHHFRSWTTREIIEQAYKGNVLLDKLSRTNQIPVVAGMLHVPVSFVDDPQGDSFRGADIVATGGVDPDTIAKYQVAYYIEPVKSLWTDEQEVGGSELAVGYIEHLVEQSLLRQSVLLGRDLAASAQGTTKDLLPLEVMAPAAPSATTLGGISQTSNTAWANQAQASFGSFTTYFSKFDTLSVACQKGGLTDWDWGVCDTTTYLRFKKYYRTFFQLQIPPSYKGESTGDLGVRSKQTDVFFDGRPIYHDRHLSDTWTRYRTGAASASISGPAASNGVVFFINNRALKLATVKGAEFMLTPWKPMESQVGRICHRIWAGQLVCQERSALGRADGITA